MKIRKIVKKGGARTAALIVATVLATIGTPKANALTMTFSGTLDSVGIFGPSTGIWTGLAPGDFVSLSVDFNFTGTDLAAHPDVFVSNNSINSAQLVVDAHTLNFGSGSVSVVNNLAGIDEFVLNLNPANQTPGATPDFQGLQLLFNDPTGLAFSSVSLELALEALNGQHGQFDLIGPGNEAHATLNVSRVAAVPDTGYTGLMLATVLAAFAGIKALRERRIARPLRLSLCGVERMHSSPLFPNSIGHN